MHFMLQKEVVVRMAAAPGSGDYGRLTVMLAPHVQVESLFDIGAGAFKPAPQVTSTFFALHPHATPPFEVPDAAAFAAVVLAAFSKRRKTLRNSLLLLLDAEGIQAAGVDPGARAETLSPTQFAALTRQWLERRGNVVPAVPAE
jgi:16S rRNA (adenine1518-N6/adenine1519-N6)-dimethyltransferase